MTEKIPVGFSASDFFYKNVNSKFNQIGKISFLKFKEIL